MSEKQAKEIMDEVIENVSLDRFLDRNPKTLTEADYREIVATARKQRAMFIADEVKKKEKKESKNVT